MALQVYKRAWQQASGVLKGEKFHAWFAIPEQEGAESVQLPSYINTPLEVLVAQWLATKEGWDRRIASRALEGKVLAPKSKEKFDTRSLCVEVHFWEIGGGYRR